MALLNNCSDTISGSTSQARLVAVKNSWKDCQEGLLCFLSSCSFSVNRSYWLPARGHWAKWAFCLTLYTSVVLFCALWQLQDDSLAKSHVLQNRPVSTCGICQNCRMSKLAGWTAFGPIPFINLGKYSYGRVIWRPIYFNMCSRVRKYWFVLLTLNTLIFKNAKWMLIPLQCSAFQLICLYIQKYFHLYVKLRPTVMPFFLGSFL